MNHPYYKFVHKPTIVYARLVLEPGVFETDRGEIVARYQEVDLLDLIDGSRWINDVNAFKRRYQPGDEEARQFLEQLNNHHDS